MSKPVSWEDQRIFLAVLEEGSLSGAARRLGLSHPTVRARLEGLERDLGTVLFTRSVNGLTPTSAAEALRAPARAMAMASQLFIRQASGPAEEVAGSVRISVPDMMGMEVVPPMLARLRRKAPALRIELELSNRPADLLSQEVDVAVRTVEPRQAALVARKVAEISLGFFASPDYLARRGTPQNAEELKQHDTIGPDRSAGDLALAAGLGMGESADFSLVTDSHPAQLAAARAGCGIAATQVPVGDRDPGLVRVLPGLELARLPTWIVTHENLAKLPRVRAVFDHLVAEYRQLGRSARAGGASSDQAG
ncbi:transcriptional regulator, LysR family [Pseudooceanicola antarcticus]|uniref:LysR family transcriptional regulator n=1 Tax=Pseudooceanicola antarcticus TaxID=1247613 RepID=A0A285J5A2_9RHOB|nr:LysR family transcriptional regulator [Pseudooceanicola antarcticus]PJE26853.1 LysR family transcriptional regulator [Pseudooceanicola antarcticus]SNY55520.1 transcriptional regulator, LysR family [Pseudooceanicola antarcticus]